MCCFNCENIPAGLFLLLWWSSDGIRAERAELCSEAAACWHSCLFQPINKTRNLRRLAEARHKQAHLFTCWKGLRKYVKAPHVSRFLCATLLISGPLYSLLCFLQSFIHHHPPAVNRGEAPWELHICRVRGGEGGAQREESVLQCSRGRAGGLGTRHDKQQRLVQVEKSDDNSDKGIALVGYSKLCL